MERRVARAEVPVAETWNLDDIFPTAAAWAEELSRMEGDLPAVTQFRGRLAEGAGVLAACLDAREQLLGRLERVTAWARLRAAEDGTSADNQAAAARAAALGARVQAALSFTRSEILALPGGTLEQWLAGAPELAPFGPMLKVLLRARPYALAAETEAVLAALDEVLDAPHVIYSRAKLADLQFDPIRGRDGREWPLSFALYLDRYELSGDTDLRRRAFTAFIGGLRRYQHTMAATLATEVRKHVVAARLRGYDSATHMLLHEQQVTPEVYHGIIDTILTDLAPHMRRYARLRQRVLGLDRVLHCDMKSPLDPGYRPTVSFPEAAGLIVEALGVLGPEYQDIMRQAVTGRWIDRTDNIGKATGAFCATPWGVHSYILITWGNTMRGAFVLAHELGHAGHRMLTMRHQRLTSAQFVRFFSEAPSTLNELLLGQHILGRTGEPRLRRWVVDQLLQTYYHNFVTHLLEAELQRQLFALAGGGTPITAALLDQVQGDVLDRFWAGAMEIDEGARLTWARQPHYYMGLYPYTYAAGLTVATAVAHAIAAEGPPAVERWLRVLKAGSTLPPLELTQLAGVDMSGPEPVRRAVAYVGALVDELESSLRGTESSTSTSA